MNDEVRLVFNLVEKNTVNNAKQKIQNIVTVLANHPLWKDKDRPVLIKIGETDNVLDRAFYLNGGYSKRDGYIMTIAIVAGIEGNPLTDDYKSSSAAQNFFETELIKANILKFF